MLERIQKICLKVILGGDYLDYSAALELCGLQTLSERREKRCLDFTVKALKHPKNQKMFPINPNYNKHIRGSEPFVVNFAKTETYKKSTIPYCQRLLNKNVSTRTSSKWLPITVNINISIVVNDSHIFWCITMILNNKKTNNNKPCCV